VIHPVVLLLPVRKMDRKVDRKRDQYSDFDKLGTKWAAKLSLTAHTTHFLMLEDAISMDKKYIQEHSPRCHIRVHSVILRDLLLLGAR
jgi:hypothetical protein